MGGTPPVALASELCESRADLPVFVGTCAVTWTRVARQVYTYGMSIALRSTAGSVSARTLHIPPAVLSAASTLPHCTV